MRAFSRWWDPSATSKAEWESLLERGPSLAITIEIPDIVRDLVVQHRAEIPPPPLILAPHLLIQGRPGRLLIKKCFDSLDYTLNTVNQHIHQVDALGFGSMCVN